MQSNRLSAHNTQASSTQRKVETVKGKKAAKLAVIENELKLGTTTRSYDNTTRADNFDFAGLAG